MRRVTGHVVPNAVFCSDHFKAIFGVVAARFVFAPVGELEGRPVDPSPSSFVVDIRSSDETSYIQNA
jgi:hypothetical protein